MGQYYRQALRQDGQTRLFSCQYADKGDNDWNNYQDYNPIKLMEHSWLKNPFLMAMTKQLYNHRGKLVWCGDYAGEPDDFKNIGWTSYGEIYNCNDDRLEILPNDGDFDYTHKYLLNMTKKVYVDFNLYISKCDSDGWIVHPLSLLTAVGNGRGGGDYYDEYPDAYLVGSWAGDELKVVDKVPAGYELEDVRFIEDSGYDDDRVE
jgi:hypothetical protein